MWERHVKLVQIKTSEQYLWRGNVSKWFITKWVSHYWIIQKKTTGSCSLTNPAIWGLFSLPSLTVFTCTFSQSNVFSPCNIILTRTFLFTVSAKYLAFASPIFLLLYFITFLLYLCDHCSGSPQYSHLHCDHLAALLNTQHHSPLSCCCFSPLQAVLASLQSEAKGPQSEGSAPVSRSHPHSKHLA